MGCDRQHNLLFGLVSFHGREESPEDRNTTEPRHLAGRLTVSVADQPGEDLRFAVPQSQHGRGSTRADLIGQA